MMMTNIRTHLEFTDKNAPSGACGRPALQFRFRFRFRFRFWFRFWFRLRFRFRFRLRACAPRAL